MARETYRGKITEVLLNLDPEEVRRAMMQAVEGAGALTQAAQEMRTVTQKISGEMGRLAGRTGTKARALQGSSHES